MIKYSFIVPCYNGEKYIVKCLDSILKQTSNNYEVIVINDGSTDNSINIINKYKNDKKIVIINQNNMGLSLTRNNGINKAKGEYLIFVDCDDYIQNDFLKTIDKNLNDEDMLKIGYTLVYDNKEEVINNISFESNGEQAFKKLIDSRLMFEMSQQYIIKKDYMIDNNYYFEKNKYHEDLGLIPYMIINAKKVKSIPYSGYMYVQTNNSITRNSDAKKENKKALDVLYFFDKYKNTNNKLFQSYMANACINKLKYLDKEDKIKYKKELKTRKIYKYLLSNNLKRKIKKILAFINLDLIVYR